MFNGNKIKKINKLKSKGMVNIYLKVTIDNNFDFPSSKNSSPGQTLVSSNKCRYWILTLLAANWKPVVW